MIELSRRNTIENQFLAVFDDAYQVGDPVYAEELVDHVGCTPAEAYAVLTDLLERRVIIGIGNEDLMEFHLRDREPDE